jgi:hypothetical protein
LGAAYDDRTTIGTSDVYLEGSKTSFARCLKTLLGRDYDFFEQARQREEAKLLSGPAVNEVLQQFHEFFQKDPALPLSSELTVTIGEQLSITNTSAYHTIHQAPPVQYYFNPARTKASPYPWNGIKQYGPFSKDTFPKRTPTILVARKAPQRRSSITSATGSRPRGDHSTKAGSPNSSASSTRRSRCATHLWF